MPESTGKQYLCEAEGLVHIGDFLRRESRKEGDREFHSIILGRRKYDGGVWEMSLSFEDFDRDTGEQSPVSFLCGQMASGTRVAVSVTGQVSKAGKVWYKATGITELPPAGGAVSGRSPVAAVVKSA